MSPLVILYANFKCPWFGMNHSEWIEESHDYLKECNSLQMRETFSSGAHVQLGHIVSPLTGNGCCVCECMCECICVSGVWRL